MDIKEVKLSDIYADMEFNCRKDMGTAKEQAAFAESIKAQGQLMPGLIAGEPIPDGKEGAGKHLLIAGYRRYLALCQINAKGTMAVSVLSTPSYSRECYTLNAKENIERKDLSTYEKARMCADYKARYKLTDAEVAQALRGSTEMNAKHVNNLIRNIEDLHPDILEAWRKRHPVCSTDRLNILRVLPQDEQQTRFVGMCADSHLPQSADDAIKEMAARGGAKRGVRESDKAPEIGPDGKPIPGTEKADKPTRPGAVLVDFVANLVKETSEISDHDKATVARVFAWTQGVVQSLMVGKVLVYDHSAHIEAEKAAKAKAKESKKTESLAEQLAKLPPEALAALLAKVGK